MRPFYILCLLLLLPVADALAGTARAREVQGTRLEALKVPGDDSETRVYIVQFRAPAAISEQALQQDVATQAAAPTTLHQAPERTGARARARRVTEARKRRFNPAAPAVRRYADRLVTRHDAVLATVDAVDNKVYSYRYAFNGVAVRLNATQARKLRARKDVLNVWLDRPKFVETSDSPAFLGLLSKNGGLRGDLGLRGENVVIGVIDSGIAPGHPSLRDTQEPKMPRLCRSEWGQASLLGRWLCLRFKRRDSTLVYSPLPGWSGECQAGERFLTTYCNNKLIGARYYINGFLKQYELDDNEIVSPRDADGHGTHIATTAGGNGADAILSGTKVARIAGMAPRARIAVYKACWLRPLEQRGTCSTSDLTQAIEDAVADGVDIINYSVGSNDDINDADDLALLAASDAGILVVAAAGNDGPVPRSIDSPGAAPWVLTVGASSRRGDYFREAIRVNSPPSVKKDYAALEAGFTPRLRDVGPLTLRLILVNDGTNGVFDGVTGTTFDGCETFTNRAEIDGQVALLERGGCLFETKIRNAQNAGAKAVLVFSNQGEPIVMTGLRGSVRIPALMIGQADGQLLRERLADDDPVEVTLDKSVFLTARDAGNQMQGFSARGPGEFTPNILKPDVTAPGVDILAGYTPDAANDVRGERFHYLSGTSMAVPHVVGVAALLKEAHPEWSPAMLKSALITTSRQNVRKEDGSTAADPFDFGGGHVVPNLAVAPGLVYEAGSEDYDAYLCGRGEARPGVDCTALETAGYATDGSGLNLPSIAVDELVNEQVIRRRVTNAGEGAQFTASVQAPTTISVEVTPAILALNAGESAEFEIRLTSDGTDFDTWQFGSLSWASAASTVRSPLAIRALPFAAPPVVDGSGTTGSAAIPLRIGYSGSYESLLSGLEASGQSQSDVIRAQLTNSVVDDPANFYVFVQPTAGTPPASVRRIPLLVPASTRYLRVALTNQNSSPGANLDLYLYHCPGFGECIATTSESVNEGSEETINLVPAAGDAYLPAGEYYVDVHGYNAPTGAATFQLFAWTVGANRGNATLAAPSSVTSGSNEGLTLNWLNLEAGLHLGLITHSDGSTVLDQTVIEVTAP